MINAIQATPRGGNVLVAAEKVELAPTNTLGLAPGRYVVGAEALEQYRSAMRDRRPFAAVIFDLTVPGGMGGNEAVEKILALDAGAKAIVASGYSDDPVMANFAACGFSGMVAKPFKLDELSLALHSVLNREGSDPEVVSSCTDL